MDTIRFRLLNGDERTNFIDATGNTHTLVDSPVVDGVLQTVVAINRATCDVVRNL